MILFSIASAEYTINNVVYALSGQALPVVTNMIKKIRVERKVAAKVAAAGGFNEWLRW